MSRWLNRDFHLRSQGTQPGVWSAFCSVLPLPLDGHPALAQFWPQYLLSPSHRHRWTWRAAARGLFRRTGRSTALALGKFLRIYQRFRTYLHAVELFSGALLLFVGGLIFVNKLTWLSGKLWFLSRFSL